MPSLDLIRQQEVFKAEQHSDLPIHIIGAGALGSRIWLNLVEIGLERISLYDFDSVEEHNLANQIFLKSHVGMKKVDAAKDYWKLKTGSPVPETMEFIDRKIQTNLDLTWNGPDDGIIILAVDTMELRSKFFERFALSSNYPFFIDVRMASSYGNVFLVNLNNSREIHEYRESIIPDDQAEVSACGTQISVGPTANIIASIATWQLMNAINDLMTPDYRVNIFLQPFTAAAEEITYYDRDKKQLLSA